MQTIFGVLETFLVDLLAELQFGQCIFCIDAKFRRTAGANLSRFTGMQLADSLFRKCWMSVGQSLPGGTHVYTPIDTAGWIQNG